MGTFFALMALIEGNIFNLRRASNAYFYVSFVASLTTKHTPEVSVILYVLDPHVKCSGVTESRVGAGRVTINRIIQNIILGLS